MCRSWARIVRKSGIQKKWRSTFFLAGPARQCRRMGKEKRWVASLVFVGSLVLTILIALSDFHGRALLVLILVILLAATTGNQHFNALK